MSGHRTTRSRVGPQRAATGWGVLAVLGVLLAAPPAAAHPFGERFYAHRLVLRAQADRLLVQYSTEIPAREVMRWFAEEYAGAESVGEEQDRAFTQRILGQLGGGLTVYVGSEPVEVRWGAMPDQRSGVGTGEFFVYHLQAELPLSWSADPIDVLVTNDNALDAPAYYSGWVFSEASVRATQSSVAAFGAEAAGEDVFQVESAWSRNPIYRDLAASFVAGGAPAADEDESTPGARPPARWLWPSAIVVGIALAGAAVVLLRRRAR